MVALLRRLQPTRQPAPPWADEPDSLLVARARNDPLAFEPLYMRYVEEIARFCFARLRDRECARDAAQQTFARALVGLPTYREQGQFRSWLYAIARNVIADETRRMRPQQSLETVTHLASTALAPEAAALDALSRQALLEAISRLPADQREAMELRMTGLKGVEIADVMHRSHESVRMLQKRAIDRLRRELGGATETQEGRHGA